MNNEQESIAVVEEYLEKTAGNLESIGDSIDSLRVISGNLQDITDAMRLTLWKMDVLTDLRKLKSIYHMTHQEWIDMPIDDMLDLVEAIEEVGHPQPCPICTSLEEERRAQKQT